MWNAIYEFIDSGLLGILLQVLGIGVAIFLLVVLYRLYVVLGLIRQTLQRVLPYRSMIKDVMIEFRKFCLRYNSPFNDEE